MQKPSKPSPNPQKFKKTWIAAAIAVLSILAVSAAFAIPHVLHLLENTQGQNLTSNLAGALPPSLQGNQESEEYEEYEDEIPYDGPSSAYIEAGADSKVLQFGFGSENPENFDQDDRKMPRLMSDDNVQAVVSRNQNDLIACYGEELQYDEDLAGKVDFEFAIAPDGHVAMVRVTRSTLRSKDAEDCFVEKARHWKFPRTNQDILTRFETDFTFATN